jgi:tripartite-type tricarboxylate transporter receptor subunit TctC
MRKPITLLFALVLGAALAFGVACGGDPTATAVPPTNTQVPPADTQVPPANTPAPTLAPGETPRPTPTPKPTPQPPAPTPTLLPVPKISYPDRIITWVIPASPGGSWDTLSRGIMPIFSENLGVRMVVKNQPSGGGLIAEAEIYGDSEGYKIGMVDMVAKPALALIQDLPYDPFNFQYIGRFNAGFNSLATGINSPFKTLDDIINATEPVRCGNTLGFSTIMMQCVMLADILGFPMTIVNFPGIIETVQGVIRGDADVSPLGLALWLRFSEDSRNLFIWGPERDPRAPDVPALNDIGVPELAPFMVQRVGAVGPNVAPERLQILRDAFERSVLDPRFQTFVEDRQYEKNFMRGADVQALADNELFPLLRTKIEVLRAAAEGS